MIPHQQETKYQSAYMIRNNRAKRLESSNKSMKARRVVSICLSKSSVIKVRK